MENFENVQCPICGYYCLGNGGYGCIDKPKLVQDKSPCCNAPLKQKVNCKVCSKCDTVIRE